MAQHNYKTSFLRRKRDNMPDEPPRRHCVSYPLHAIGSLIWLYSGDDESFPDGKKSEKNFAKPQGKFLGFGVSLLSIISVALTPE